MPKPSKNMKREEAATPNRARAPTVEMDVAALLERYGIITVPRHIYEWGGFRYTNPGDAIAAAKRGAHA